MRLSRCLLSILPLLAPLRADNASPSAQEKDGTCDDDSPLLYNPTVSLHNGVEMPTFHLGTAQLITPLAPDPDAPSDFVGMQPERMYRQMELALTAGIRAFDTALIYRSQPPMGHVLGEWWRTGKLNARKDVWITSKVFHPRADACFGISQMPNMSDMTPEQVSVLTKEHLERSLSDLNIGYIDLMLLHWPGGWPDGSGGNGEDMSAMSRQRRLAAWKVLEDAYARGWCRAIGVSNFDVKHLEQLQEDGATIVPMVNQIEASVEVQHVAVREYCQHHNIVLQSYSSLRGVLNADPAPILTQLATKYDKDIGQVAFRYLHQRGYGTIIFLTNSAKRMKSNLQIWDFELTDEEMKGIDALNDDEAGWGLPRPHEIH